VTGARRSVKVFGSVEVRSAGFLYHRDEVFNARTYLVFLERLARAYYPRKVIQVQDNASYHKDKDVWAWFKENRRWWEVHNLPPYSPDLSAAEPVWKHTRLRGTHNRYFATEEEIVATLTSVFRSIQRSPEQIMGYMRPFS
jgi:transposase